MKSARLLALWFAHLASCAVIEKRQGSSQPIFDLSAVAALVPSINPSTIRDVKPMIQEKAKRQLIRYGPYTLPANIDGPHDESHESRPPLSTTDILSGQTPMDPNGFSVAGKLAEGICKDCTILAGKTDLVFANDTRADLSMGVYLHHVIIFDYVKPLEGFVSACPVDLKNQSQSPLRPAPSFFLGGAVDEYTQWYTRLDRNMDAGYYVKDSQFLMQAEAVNYTPRKQEVFIQIDLEYVPGKPKVDAIMQFISAEGCPDETNVWMPQQGTSGNITSNGFSIYRDGTIIAARGHMHDGGTAINVYLNDELICSSKAIYGGTGGTLEADGKEWQSIAKMTECLQPVAVKKGDYIGLEATYDTKAHPARESHGEMQESMAPMHLSFLPIDANN